MTGRRDRRASPNATLVRRYAAYVAVAAAALALAGLHAASVVRRLAREQTVRSLTEAATMLANVLRASDEAQARLLVDRAGSATVRCTAIGTDGAVIADSWSDAATLENHADRPEVQEAMNGRIGVASRTSASVGQELLYVALPPVRVGDLAVVVRTASTIRGVEEPMRAVYRDLALAALVILLFITLVTLVVERRMVEPIAALERAAEAFRRGDLSHYLRVSYPRDLARVAAAMNGMAEGLREQMRRLGEQRDELEAVFSAMGEAVLVVDPAQRIRSVNAAAMSLVRLEPGRVEGRLLLDVLRAAQIGELVREVQASGRPREIEVTLHGAAGGGAEAVHVQARATRLERGSGGVVLVLADVSRLKRLEEVRRDFVANVSHELKTPITTIKASLETLLDGAREDPEASQRFLESASRHAERLHAIVDDLLSLSALERPAGALGAEDWERRDLRQVAQAALHLLSRRAEDKGISLRLEAPDAVTASVHARLLEQAIANLLDNAIKYSPRGSDVALRVERRAALAVVSVVDRGIGIPAADLPRVFERFYRVDKARSRDLGGTGLGLAIVKHIALVHGGSVEAESTPGEGSTFRILLPATGVDPHA